MSHAVVQQLHPVVGRAAVSGARGRWDDVGSTPESADGLQRHAAGAPGGTSVGLLETNGADIAPDLEAGIIGVRMPASRDLR